jgi:CBS domain-containing protein
VAAVTPQAHLGQEVGQLLIEHILHRKGADVVTVDAQATVADAVALLREHNVGALVVTAAEDDAPVAGILSERDVVRTLGETSGPGAADPLAQPVSALMSTDVTTCTSGASVDHVMRLMTDRRIRHIPVVDGGHLAGIVSIGDVVKSRIDELETETSTLHDYLSSGR